ncbi:MAG: hypothetical protein SV862_16815, partial [Pseudomonadota bacterium]|nr:hypothetical protein [Pseudomonadota bacterium]
MFVLSFPCLAILVWTKPPDVAFSSLLQDVARYCRILAKLKQLDLHSSFARASVSARLRNSVDGRRITAMNHSVESRFITIVS